MPTADPSAAVALSPSAPAQGQSEAKRLALRIATVGLAACDVARATAQTVSLSGDELIVDGARHRLDPEGRLVVLGAGKASLAIAAELERILGERISGGLIVVRDGEERELERLDVLGADHPLPSQRSVDAAARLLDHARAAGERDVVIACFTGGSSALASLPPDGVSTEDKRRLHELLLASGIGIVEVNSVRKHVSGFKGGRMAAAVHPARLINLSVSDVAGDPIDAITDPSVADTSTAADAVATLRGHGLWDETAESIRRHLETASAESPDLGEAEIQTVLLVTGTTACDAMALEATALGVAPVVVSTTLEGEARQVGKMLANLAAHSAVHGAPFARGTAMLGCGGESTVRLAPGAAFGEGGPNQEAAIAAALELDGLDVAAVFLDTDGSDGGTGHAGAIVDGETAVRAADAGLDLRSALLEHRSHGTVSALGDALVTGPTGTNVNDLFAIVIGAGR